MVSVARLAESVYSEKNISANINTLNLKRGGVLRVFKTRFGLTLTFPLIKKKLI
jgi:hypothetical protein